MSEPDAPTEREPRKYLHAIKNIRTESVRVEHGLGTYELVSVTVWRQVSPHAIYPGGPMRVQVFPQVAILDKDTLLLEFGAPLFRSDEYLAIIYG